MPIATVLMSHSSHCSMSNLSSVLPKEIWLEILDLATLHPLDSDFSLTCTRRSVFCSGFALKRGWDPVLSSRLNIVQVCWEWYHLSIGYLYQTVLLWSVNKEAKLITALKDNKELATLIRRVRFFGMPSFNSSEWLKSCENVESISSHRSVSLPTWLLAAWDKRALRQLFAEIDPRTVLPVILPYSIPSYEHLDSASFRIDSHTVTSSGTPHFPHLRTLLVAFHKTSPALAWSMYLYTWELPSLVSFAIEDTDAVRPLLPPPSWLRSLQVLGLSHHLFHDLSCTPSDLPSLRRIQYFTAEIDHSSEPPITLAQFPLAQITSLDILQTGYIQRRTKHYHYLGILPSSFAVFLQPFLDPAVIPNLKTITTDFAVDSETSLGGVRESFWRILIDLEDSCGRRGVAFEALMDGRLVPMGVAIVETIERVQLSNTH